MKPTVYLLTLHAGEMLAKTLRAVQAQEPAVDIVLADNGAGEGCARWLEREFPGVTRVGFGRNLGFAPAMKRAIEATDGDPIILLNDDAEPRPGFVAALLDAYDDDVDMVAAVLVSERDPRLIDSAGVIADKTLMGFDYLTGEPVEALATAADPLGPTGGAALYRRSALEAVGNLDDRMFLYYDDLDIALRLRARGSRCRLAREAIAVHAYSATTKARSAGKYARSGWSRGYMMRRYGVTRRPRAAARAIAAELTICAGQLLYDHTLKGLSGRLRGWHAGRGLPRREAPPPEALLDISLGEALALRRRRHSF